MAKALHWLTFDRLPSFASLLRGCFPNGDGIALALDPSLAFVLLFTWTLPWPWSETVLSLPYSIMALVEDRIGVAKQHPLPV